LNKSADTFYKPTDDCKITKIEIDKAIAEEKNNAALRFLKDKVEK
jgi:hypothetical protein